MGACTPMTLPRPEDHAIGVAFASFAGVLVIPGF